MLMCGKFLIIFAVVFCIIMVGIVKNVFFDKDDKE
jgi:hypothetical protein